MGRSRNHHFSFSSILLATGIMGLASACSSSDSNGALLGTLEWDRIAIPAEVSEPIISIAVKEGDHVESGQLILALDSRRITAQVDAAQAEVKRMSAALDELRHGARPETIDASRAGLARAETTASNARKARDRAADLRHKGLNSQADLDNAETALRQAEADTNVARANLAVLLKGTRIEELLQGEAGLAQARANLTQLQVTLQRLEVHAPRAGRVDALPFKLNDRPPAGASVVSLLVGDAPYARVFIPESHRAITQQGAHYSVHVDGINTPFTATLVRIRSEASFTPYYALSGDDASRLTYRAELLLDGATARELPAGIPCQAIPLDHVSR
jgi:HlyD family secretion protein